MEIKPIDGLNFGFQFNLIKNFEIDLQLGLLGVMLASTGYSGSVETALPATVTMIRMLFSLIPAGVYVALFIILQFYKLEKLMPQIRRENKESRLAAGNAAG